MEFLDSYEEGETHVESRTDMTPRSARMETSTTPI